MSKVEIEFAAENAAKLGDLISRSALQEKIDALPSNGSLYDADEVDLFLKNAPTIEAEPARHGR